ncbi:phytanoyl-CoA dioxygenase family protein [Tunicatimonas pelagia]|uniref:phytanoyl-CoA dioxygenase family protein n=1 Tax=Tunicatimonas pelagia TaxID=931531 RepID=UPI0026650FD8|nr:phytanoyl-CoA dioxygenase family protein [Tunicatimonas pelagia]WKN42371.1 phytanoyl-CoA dioxygenase family protein [Tunicatimonas pelagia]
MNTLPPIIQPFLLRDNEKAFLDKHGYVSLGKILDEAQLKTVRDRIQALLETEGKNAGAELLDSPHIRHPKEEGADRLADLVNKGEVFDIFYTHPRVLAGVAHVLGQQLKLSSLNYRAAIPSRGHQKLHADWHKTVAPDKYQVCNTIWLLDDFTKDNGATRLVPGTHRSGILPQEELADPWATHPDEIIIEAPAGTVVIFNSHTWHGGTNNHTDTPRRSIHSYFCRREQPQQVNQQRYIRPETYQRLSDDARRILAVNQP